MKYLDKVLLLIEEIKARNSQREELAGDEGEDLEEAEEFGEYFRDPNDYQDDDPFFDDYWDEDEGSGFYRNHTINIYELAHKCKEWALSKGYILMSKPRTSSNFATCVFCKNGKCDYEDDLWNDFRAGTESEAIFKACEWILNQKDSHAH